MTKIQYIKPKNFRRDTVLLLEKILKVVDDYQEKGYRYDTKTVVLSAGN